MVLATHYPLTRCADAVQSRKNAGNNETGLRHFRRWEIARSPRLTMLSQSISRPSMEAARRNAPRLIDPEAGERWACSPIFNSAVPNPLRTEKACEIFGGLSHRNGIENEALALALGAAHGSLGQFLESTRRMGKAASLSQGSALSRAVSSWQLLSTRGGGGFRGCARLAHFLRRSLCCVMFLSADSQAVEVSCWGQYDR